VQVHAAVKGDFPDACTSIGTVNQRREGNTIYVELMTTRPADMACAQVITPFEHNIPLDVVGLPAGTYTVDVNGVTETFTLDVDNKMS
jgi:inhibitor of cysteine peptidase